MLYRIELPTDDSGLVQAVLEGLAFRFDDDQVTVDTSVANPARICKLYGTWAQKGDDIPNRPHRMARLLEVPDEVMVVSTDQLAAVASWRPQASDIRAQNTVANGQSATRGSHSFDLDAWIDDHDLEVIGPTAWQDGRKWVLPVCPFNQDHTNHSAFVVQFENGAIAAGCHHHSCDGNDWHALRDLVEPGWRDRGSRRFAGYSANSANSAR